MCFLIWWDLVFQNGCSEICVLIHFRNVSVWKPSCVYALSLADLISAGRRPTLASRPCLTCRRSIVSWRSCRCRMMNQCFRTLPECLWRVGLWVRLGERSWPRGSADSVDTDPSHPPLPCGAQSHHPRHISATRWDAAYCLPMMRKCGCVFIFC